MKRGVLVLALMVLAAAAVFAIPTVYTTHDDGWMMGGIGLSVSLPDFRLSPIFEFEVGGPEQIGMTVTIMFGSRFLATLGVLYIVNPSPGSIFGIPIIARVGLIDGSFSGSGDLQLGMALSSGVRVYPMGWGATEDDRMDLTADVEATVYWNFGSAVSFSIDGYPGIMFTLVDTGYTYIPTFF